jgi:hypothetical protein
MRTKDLVNLEEAVNKVYLKEEDDTVSITLSKNTADYLLELILDPTKYENQTNQEFVSFGFKDLAQQLNNILGGDLDFSDITGEE